MDAGFWLGFATPFAVLILSAAALLLICATVTLMRLLNGKVHDRFIRRYEFPEDIDADGGTGHERNARELAEAFASAPGFHKIMIGPWQIAICRDYRYGRPKRTGTRQTSFADKDGTD